MFSIIRVILITIILGKVHLKRKASLVVCDTDVPPGAIPPVHRLFFPFWLITGSSAYAREPVNKMLES